MQRERESTLILPTREINKSTESDKADCKTSLNLIIFNVSMTSVVHTRNQYISVKVLP